MMMIFKLIDVWLKCINVCRVSLLDIAEITIVHFLKSMKHFRPIDIHPAVSIKGRALGM